MRLSNKQAQMLIEILRATLRISNLATYDNKTRQDLYHDIINQQDDEVVELGNGDEFSVLRFCKKCDTLWKEYSKVPPPITTVQTKTCNKCFELENEQQKTTTDSPASPDGS